jgi:aspartate-semialdehyde dehydrogenase
MDQQDPSATPGAADIATMVHGVRPLHIAVVGATGNVGTTILEVLEERGIPMASLRAFASERSAGSSVTCGSQTVKVENLSEASLDLSGIDVALFSAGGDRSLEHAARFVEAGAIVIDNSSAFRMDEDVPLVVPEVNPEALASIPRGIVANPNCSTIQLVTALRPIHDTWELQRVTVTTMQSTSGTGHAAMQELEHQSRVVMGVAAEEPRVYPHEIAFNVLPHCGDFEADGFTSEEHKLRNETRKILDLPELRVVATCTRVPVFIGHSESVTLELERGALPDQVRELLAASPGIELADDPTTNDYPLPRDAAGRDEVFVGRIRTDPTMPDNRGLALYIVADNLRKGAATNAVQIVEELARRGTWS